MEPVARKRPARALFAAAAASAAALGFGSSPALAAAAEGVSAPVVALVLLLGAVLGAAAATFWGRRRISLLRDAMASVPRPRQVVDSEGRTAYANPACVEAFADTNRPAPDVLRAGAADPESQRRIERLAEAVADGRSGQAEIRVRQSGPGAPGEDAGDAAVAWRSVAAYPLERHPGSAFWCVDDPRPERQLEEATGAERQRFSDLLGNAPIGFYAVDAEGRILFANRILAEWLGLTREELEGGRRLHDLLARTPPEGRAPGDLFGDGAEQGEVRLRAPGGEGFPALVVQSVERADDGRVLCTRAAVRNLTEERAKAEALERAERRFESFFGQAPVGIALVDGRGVVTEFNDAVRAMAGVDAEVTGGMPLADLVAEESRPLVEDLLERTGPSEDGDEDPLEVEMAGGGKTVCALSVRPMDHDGEALGGLIAHFIDTTEQKKLEQQFAHSMKMQAVGQLAGGIAHDFNNLLTAMIGFSDLLLLRHRPGDQSFADIMQIKQNANRAANLVRHLLAFSRQQTLQPKVLDLTDILAELSNLLRRLIGENIDLKMIHGRDLGMIKVDQAQLEQVIINLAVNARDAMPEGGTLAIRTDSIHLARATKRKGEAMPAGDYTQIEVADSGCGVLQENLDRIFEPFFTTKEVGAGTGLGLSMVYGIVKQTGGFIFVDSELDAGTTFTILLPCHVQAQDGAAKPEVGAEVVSDQSGSGTLLLVEDEDAVRAFSARALRSKGYDVLEARSGEAALELLGQQQKPIDLLITDVVMPRIDGPTLVREIRGARPDLKVIFISGYAETTFRERLDQGGGIHFLPKPFSLKQLAGKVKEVMRDAAA
jgi:two-component system cell cycle sensor histidine kinase/response regulator CckA